VSAAGENLQVEWGGAKDSGVGLCETNRTTEEGWVLTQSKNKSNPIIAVPNGKSLTSNFQVVDCRGNALTGKLSTKSSFVSASSARRTGKWEEVKSAFSGSMRCIGRCTITTSAKGSLSIIAGAGAADVLVSSKKVGSISPSTAETPRTGISLELGESKKVVRIQGRNFSIHGFIGLDFQTREVKQINLFDRPIDDSLKDSIQKELSNFGFSSDDFDATWNVLPMARGTTLLDPTLDLCEYEYVSDKNRSARRQVTASKVGSPYIFLSTETVRYKSSVEAKAALAELKSNLQKCISDGGGLNRTGAKTVYQFSPNQIPRMQGMVGDSNGVFVHAIIGTGAQARALLGFYQFEGDLFSGLYVVGNQASFFSQAQVDHWADVAATMGKRLQGRS
jgi:hypothetical protein